MDERLRTLQRSVGRRVSELRNDAGMTQSALAERYGVDVKFIQDIEGGRQNLTLKSLLRLSDALSVELASLFEAPASLYAPPGPGRPRKT